MRVKHKYVGLLPIYIIPTTYTPKQSHKVHTHTQARLAH